MRTVKILALVALAAGLSAASGACSSDDQAKLGPPNGLQGKTPADNPNEEGGAPVNPPHLIEIAEGHCVEASAPPVLLTGWAASRVRA